MSKTSIFFIKKSIRLFSIYQPENLSFTTTNNKIGGNVYLKLNHFTFQNNDTFIKGIGFFSEIFYKTDGFLSEYASLENDFGLRFGISISY